MTAANPSLPAPDTIILCEGYHDRAFWSGFLAHRGCTRPSGKSLDTPGPVRERDAWGGIGGGTFGFRTPTGSGIRVMPCHGDTRVVPAARLQLEKRNTNQPPLRRLILCVDADVDADDDAVTRDHVETLVKHHDPAATPTPDGFTLDAGALTVSILQWHSDCAASTPGVPDKQTLERIVCSALASVWPDRATAVQAWLDSRPNPVASPKAASWSFMAGWFPDHGSEAFLKLVWATPEVANELERQLALLVGWTVVEAAFAS